MSRLLRAREVAELAGISRSTAYKLMDRLGAVYPIGSAKRLPKDRLDAYLRRVHEQSPIYSVPEMEPPCTPGVYAAQGVGGYIKIGKASDIARRLREFRVAHPEPLRLLAVLSKYMRDERFFHERWSHLRCHGEWFDPTPELISYIKQVRGL